MNSPSTHAYPIICRFFFVYSRYGYNSKNLHATYDVTICSPSDHANLKFLWEFFSSLFSPKLSYVDASSSCVVGLAYSPLFDWISCNTWEICNPWPYGQYCRIQKNLVWPRTRVITWYILLLWFLFLTCALQLIALWKQSLHEKV